MKSIRVYFVLFVCALFANGLCYAQNQSVIDSLLLELETGVSDKKKVDIYVKLASEYQNSDSTKTMTFSNKAIALANKTGYLQGAIDPLYPVGVMNMNKGNYDEAKRLFTQMVDLAIKNVYPKGKARAYYGLGWFNAYQGNHRTALDYLSQSVAINEKLGEKNSLALGYNLMGIVYDKQGKPEKALEYYFQSLKINKELHKKAGMASNYSNIGIIYKNQEDYEKALQYHLEARDIYEDLDIRKGLARNYSNIGIIHFMKEDYEKAMEHYVQSLKIKRELGDRRGVAYTYNHIGQASMKLGDMKVALENYFNSLEIFEELGFKGDQVYPLLYIGEAYRIQGLLLEARKYLAKALSLAQQLGVLVLIREGAQELALIENKLGNYEKAYQAHVLFKQMADSINSEENIKKITRLTAEYEFQKEKDSLQLSQRQEILLLEERAKRKENLKLSIAICIVLILITSVVIYFSANKISRRNELDALRNQISRDLHDELGTTLSSISLFGTVAEANIRKDPGKASALLEQINFNASRSVESMNDIVWTINSDMDSMQYLLNRMRSFASEIENTGNWEITINHDPLIGERTLNMLQRRSVYYIFKEAVNNAVKYSLGNTIDIDLKVEKNLVYLKIKDNGIGFDYEATTKKDDLLGGNGLRNMQSRAKELGGQLTIDSHLGEGTNVLLVFHLKHTTKKN